VELICPPTDRSHWPMLSGVSERAGCALSTFPAAQIALIEATICVGRIQHHERHNIVRCFERENSRFDSLAGVATTVSPASLRHDFRIPPRKCSSEAGQTSARSSYYPFDELFGNLLSASSAAPRLPAPVPPAHRQRRPQGSPLLLTTDDRAAHLSMSLSMPANKQFIAEELTLTGLLGYLFGRRMRRGS